MTSQRKRKISSQHISSQSQQAPEKKQAKITQFAVPALITVIDAADGAKTSVKKTENYHEFMEQVAAQFEINVDDIVQLADSNDAVVNATNFAEKKTIYFFKKGKDDAEIKATNEQEEEIIPDINVMIQAGDDYDFVTALAELIDNSIQNTKDNEGERRLEIKMIKPNKKEDTPSELHIVDNGRGMNYDEVRSWATMGQSEASKRAEPFKSSNATGKYLTSEFSKYGVGSKKAIFNIGDEVTLITKNKDTRLRYEITLSKMRLQTTREWKATITSVPATPAEKKQSFTKIIIRHVKETYMAKYNSRLLRMQLGHLYHYYIYGSSGNLKDQNASNVEEVADDDINESFDGEDSEFKKIQFYVDGVQIKGQEDELDLETQYLRTGQKAFKFEMKVVAEEKILEANLDEPSQSSQMMVSQPSKTRISSLVKGVIFYYPFKNGRETLPNPNIETSRDSEEDSLPLSERKPGLEVFWNGRLLRKSHYQHLPFMKPDRKSDVPFHCFRRIKGMLFVDSAFVVSANKHLLQEQTALVQNLINFNKRELEKQFRTWIKECHRELDEEIIFETLDASNEGDGVRDFYMTVKVSNCMYKKGDKVKLKTRPRVIGEITAILREKTGEGYEALIRVKDWSSGEVQEYPLSKIDKVLSQSEYKQEVEKVKNKQPAYIDILDTPKVEQDKRPPTKPVTAGYSLKYLSVGLYSGDQKLVSKPSTGVTLRVSRQGKPIADPLYAEANNKGIFIFHIHKLIPEFTQSGEYSFEASIGIEGVKPLDYKLKVLPSAPISLKCNCTLFTAIVGGALDSFHLFQHDQYGNTVPFDRQLACADFKLTCSNPLFKFSHVFLVKEDLQGALIEELSIDEAKMELNDDEEQERNVELEILYASLTPSKISIKVKPGIPLKLTCDPETTKIISRPLEKKLVPTIILYMVDKCDNKVIKPHKFDGRRKITCLAQSNSFNQVTTQKMNSDGYFIFQDLRIHELTSPTIIIKFNIEQEPFSNVSTTIELAIDTAGVNQKSKHANGYIKLIPDEEQKQFLQNEAHDSVDINAIAGRTLSNWKIQLLSKETNEILTDFRGVCTFSWAQEQDTSLQKGECKAPALVVPQLSAKLTKYTISIGEDTEDSIPTNFALNMNVNPVAGPPAAFKLVRVPPIILSGEKASLAFVVTDAYANRLNLKNDIGFYPQLEEVKPEVHVTFEDSDAEPVIFTPTRTRNKFLLDDLVLSGTAPNNVKVVIKDAARIIPKDEIARVKFQHGKARKILINKSPELQMQIKHHQIVPSLSISVHDEHGNLVIDDQFSMGVETSDGFDFSYVDEDGGPLESDEIGMKDGILTYPSTLFTAGTGKFTASFVDESKSSLTPAVLILDVRESNYPKIIKVLELDNEESHTMVAGETLETLRCQIIGADGKFSKISRAVTLEITDPAGAKTSFVSAIPSSQGATQQDPVYTFSKMQKTMEKCGRYQLLFKVDLSSLKYATFLKDDAALSRTVVIDVTPGKAESLQLDPKEFQIPTISNTGGVEKRTFWADSHVSIVAVDSFGNCDQTFSAKGKIEVVAENKKGGKQVLPSLEGATDFTIREGKADLKQLYVKEKQGSTGRYLLRLVCKSLNPVELQFNFTDNALLQEQQHKLQQKKQNVSAEIKSRKKEIEDAKHSAEEVQARLTAINGEKDGIISELSKEFKYKERDVEDSRKVATELKRLQKWMDEAKKKTGKPAEYGSQDKIMQRVNEIVNKEGNKSGVYGVLAELGFIDDERLNAAISKLLGSRLQTVIVKDRNAAERLRKEFKESKAKVSILPLDNVSRVYELDNHGYLKHRVVATEEDEGYVGFAANLIYLKASSDTFLRHALVALMGDTLVFEKYEQGLNFRKKVISNSKAQCPLIITLDGDRIDNSGLIYAGRDPDVKFRFGQTPATQSAEFQEAIKRKEKLERLEKVMKQVEEISKEHQEALDNISTAKQKHEKHIQELQRSLEEVSNKMNNLFQGGGETDAMSDEEAEKPAKSQKATPKKTEQKQDAKKKSPAKSSKTPNKKSPSKVASQETRASSPNIFGKNDSDEEEDIEQFEDEEQEEPQPKKRLHKNAFIDDEADEGDEFEEDDEEEEEEEEEERPKKKRRSKSPKKKAAKKRRLFSDEEL